MTDKQIIIDGVDVSGCAYFWNKECRCIQDCIDYSDGKPIIKELFYNDTGIHTDCETSPNCYYKRFKRLKEKLKKIKRIIYTCKKRNCNKECEFFMFADCQDERLHKIRKIIEDQIK